MRSAGDQGAREPWQSPVASEDIIESIRDELVMGDMGQRFEDLTVGRTACGSLLLDYGKAGRFKLTVKPCR